MLELQHNVPIPSPIRPATGRIYPFEEMSIGSFFFVEGNTKSTLTTHVHQVAKELGIKLKTRRTWMRKGKKGWELCTEGDSGAAYGTGVWRVA